MEEKKRLSTFNFDTPLIIRHLDESVPLFDFTQIINEDMFEETVRMLPNASEDFHTGFIFLSDNDIDLPNGRPVSEWPKLSINYKVQSSIMGNHIKTSLSVIERNEKGYVEWGLSFSGYDPSDEDYFKMVDKETAFRLLEKLSEKYPPFTGYNPNGGTR